MLGSTAKQAAFRSLSFSLGGYKLQGTLPIELVRFPKLKLLDLQSNHLSGTLPHEWGVLASNGSQLETLRLDRNDLVGSIPDSWCHWNSTTMRELILANNQLTGSLPSCVSRLSAMTDFSVKNNAMTGTIPSSLAKLSDLETIHMAGNRLSGVFPLSLCALKQKKMFEASADCLFMLSDNFVPCPCCTTCCNGGEETCDHRHSIINNWNQTDGI